MTRGKGQGTATTLAYIADQRRLGLHDSHAWRVCAACGEWTDAAAACDPQNTRRGFCEPCARRAGLIKRTEEARR